MEEPQESISHSQEAKQLYRSFSFGVESQITDESPENELRLAMVKDREREDQRQKELKEWRKHFEPWPVSDEPEIAKLDVESNELAKAWALLRERLPSDQRVRFAERPQDIEDVLDLVRRMENDWQVEKQKGVSGRTKAFFRRMCSRLGSHSNMLNILPSSSHYASIFCGTLQTLIQASMNYEKIAEGLSRALEEITEAVDACVKDCMVYRTQAMQHNIANLYAHIFFFLRNAIDWYLKKSIKRALSSLREDFYDRFEDEISNIKRISLAMGREAQHGSHSELRYSRIILEETVIGLQDVKREIAERNYREERAAEQRAREREAARILEMEKLKRLDDLHRFIGASAKDLLLPLASAFLSDRSKQPESGHILSDFGSLSADQTLTEYNNADNLQYDSRHLEDSIIHGQTRLPFDSSSGLLFDWHVVAALQEWTKSKSSQILNVVGSSQAEELSATAPIASYCIDLAGRSGIPVISYFCELPRRRTPLAEGMTPEMAALISLIYALIRQLVDLLPYATTNRRDQLSRESFERLNGSCESVDDALKVLGQLLDQSPPISLCIIDGLELLDDRSTQRHLALLLNILRGNKKIERAKVAEPAPMLKVLFTTSGRSRCLLDGLSRSELVFAENSSATRRIPGKVTPGRRSLSPEFFAPVKTDVEARTD
ncbi:MAG: hypothetical protein Q9219_006916 [cf. Caloplaca sp. 3 TL-2023]